MVVLRCGVRRGGVLPRRVSSLFPRPGSGQTRRRTLFLARTLGGDRLLPSSSSVLLVRMVVLCTRSASSPSRSASSSSPRLLLLRCSLRVCSVDHPKVKSTVAEPPKITHLQRRLSSTNTKHPESKLHRAGSVGHTSRESPKSQHFPPMIQ